MLYNDFVVSEIIKRFEDKEAIIFYLSDHGDEVYDFRDFVGHSFSMVSRYMVEVPFMIYVSDSLKKSHPHLVERITQVQNLPFMSDDFLHSFFDLLEIQVADLQPQRSIFDEKFNNSRARIMYGKEYSINLNLAQMLQAIIARDKHDKQDSIIAKVWLDFKNLSDSNEKEALKELKMLCDSLGFPYSHIIVESGSFKNLASFRKAGFKTSYYVPYYKSLDSNEIETHLQNIIKSQSVDYMSFAYYLYEFIKSLELKVCKDGICEDMPLLTWNEGANYKINMLEKAYLDPQVRVILAGEKGAYR